MQLKILTVFTMMALALLGGCAKTKTPPQATAQDVEAAKVEAQKEIADARAEASKDVKSAAKVSGADARVVSDAKVTGTYDVAMAKADADRKVAVEQCLTSPPENQAACKDKAAADYDAAAAAAKATRLARKT